MKTTISKYLFAVAVALSLTTSCSDLLDKEPYGVLTAENLTEDDIEGLLVSSYFGLECRYFTSDNNASFEGPTSNWIFDVRSDDAVKGGDGVSMEECIHQLEMSSLSSTNKCNLYKWRNDLYSIAAVNKAINAILDAENSNYNEVLAELRFLHAYYYFDMLKLFKYIPYLDENSIVAETTNTEFSQAEIYDKEIANLESVIGDLPETPKEAGRVSKYAGAALLAKMYAQRPGDKNWAKVKQWAAVVYNCNNGLYGIYDNFSDMTKTEYNNMGEALFSQQVTTANDNMHINYCNLLNTTRCGNYGSVLYGDNGDDFFLGSQDLVNAYRTDADGLPYLDGYPDNVNVATDGSFSGTVDPRVDLTFGRIGMPWKNTATFTGIYDEGWCRDKKTYGEYSCKKFLERAGVAKAGYPWGCSSLNFIILRFSDIVLLYAEACVETGELEKAREAVNKIRAKAKRSFDEYEQNTYDMVDLDNLTANYNISLYTEAWSDKTYARKAVRMERRLELAMEGQRWFDLVRWGEAVSTMNAYYAKEKAIQTYLDGASVTEGELYLAVPYEEITNSNGLYSDTGKD